MMNKKQAFQVVHDIRNALAIISGNTDILMLVEGASSSCEKIQLGVARILKTVEKIEREEEL